MRLELERRVEHSKAMALLSPIIAVVLTVLASSLIFAAMGEPPLKALLVYFVEPMSQGWSIEELVVKATPLVLIAIGLSLCYLSNNWNIGAEGQYVVGATSGGAVALLLQDSDTILAVPAIVLGGIAGGALYGLIPALLKVKLRTNEILTSLMLVYVAELTLDYLVRGPWRAPQGFNFPQTVTFNHTMPILVEGSRIHLGAAFAALAVVA